MRWNRALAISLVALAALIAGGAAAKGQTPTSGGPANIYAMTLDSESLPDGYVFESETLLDAALLGEASEAIDPAALDAAGFGGLYVSTYLSEDETTRIRSYVSRWDSPEAATAGFDLLEGDDAALVTDGDLQDAAVELGEEPRETTTGTYAEDETTVTTSDTTFRQGSLLVGVALETLDESEPDAELAGELAQAMQERVSAVLNGEAPETVDTTLPDRVLDVEAQGFPLQIGYLTATEVEELYGIEGTALGQSESSFVSAVALTGAEEPPPLIAIGATILPDEDAAADVVAQSGALVPSLTNGEQVDDVEVDGADSATAFRFSSDLRGIDEPDSYRIVFSVGATLAVVDVQGTASIDLAEETATALADAQAACLADDATVCELPAFPEEFVPSTPAA